MTGIDIIATAAFGLEAVVAREIRELGYENPTVENGRVVFTADAAAVCRTNLWLRSADRILIRVGEFPATTFTELFEGTKALPWTDWLPADAAFPVSGKSVRSQLFSVPDCQAIVKKAIVESMKKKYKKQWYPETGPHFAVEVGLLNNRATLTLDTSGAGLHKRGYRKLTGAAPLRETLAAALVNLSYWNPDRVLVDPFCGTGTIPIEAALNALNIAPGLEREFAAEKWPAIPTRLWHLAREEARDKARRGQTLQIRGTDIDAKVLSMARYHAKSAGVAQHIHWQQAPLAELRARQKYGCIICNPPYGQRLADEKLVEPLYREMGQVFSRLDTWSYYVITAHPHFEKAFGRRADKNRKLYNGRLRCYYYQYHGPRPPRQVPPGAEKP